MPIAIRPNVSAEAGYKRRSMGHRILLEALVKLIFTIVLLPASKVRVVIAVDYVVGGTAGWGFVPTASFYSDWASEISFVPGDKLRFRYDPTEHSVQQVSLTDYSTCNTLNPLLQYQSGDDIILLPQAGDYYFICGFSGHCDGGGMLMKVIVAAKGATPSPPNYPPPVPLNLPLSPSYYHPPPSHPPLSPPHHSPPPPTPVPQTPPPDLANGSQNNPPPAESPTYPSPPALQFSPPLLLSASPLLPTLSTPPPPTLATAASPPPPSQPKSPLKPPTPPSYDLNQNQTMSNSPAPAPITTPGSSTAPSNDTLAPTPSDYDPDIANARHIDLDMVFTGLVIAVAVIF